MASVSPPYAADETTLLPPELGRLLSHQVRGVTCDSRAVRPGYLFVAIRGFRDDGHRYLADAVARGAAGVVVGGPCADPGVPCWQVPDPRRALALAAAAFHGHPSRRLTLVGVTGTNGKTSVSYLLDSIFRQDGRRTGLLGSVVYRMANEAAVAHLTTPQATDIQAFLARALARGTDTVTMEVSSHALALERVTGCAFDAAVFTNLSRDHLDFHPSMEEYFRAKARLFHQPGAPLAVINQDDPYGRRLAALAAGRVLPYGLTNPGPLRVEHPSPGCRGWRFTLRFPAAREEVCLPLPGSFSLYNALAAATTAWGLGLSPSLIAQGLTRVGPIPGRYGERRVGGVLTVVDYAHNPDGLTQVLRWYRERTPGRLIAVFGGRGERDRGKRPQMGSLASELADLVIITSDSPGREDPAAISAEVARGIRRGNFRIILDRRRAVAAAMRHARRADTVVITGRGQEAFQKLPAGETPFPRDRELVALHRPPGRSG
ncbi:MAG: UDP-N-acetylmuramoyl-L-alanyl-D-glutamate--2,6-diaminopimelate ligase [Thermaerobacter sp.]|nr:UDP-N-acetylmuramoyl-L-alanyl-D-glutamate--2,6-diaminopimelate ligase [Thermaerobacter sp.]